MKMIAYLLLAFTMVGCATPVETPTEAPSLLTAAEYTNLVVSHLNNMTAHTQTIQVQYAQFDQVHFVADNDTTQWYQAAQQQFIEQRPQLENDAVQSEIEDKLIPYLKAYKAMLNAYQAVSDYYSTGEYATDGEAQKAGLLQNLDAAITTSFTAQQDLVAVIKQHQAELELNIDEHSQEPLEVVTLAQDTITQDIEQTYQAYTAWVKLYNEGQSAEVTTLQATYDQLSADLKTYQVRADSSSITTVASVAEGFDSYIAAAQSFANRVGTMLHTVPSQDTATLLALDQDMLTLYNAAITAHNSLVQLVINSAN